jgi:magnesium chelatase family protein
VEVTPVEFEKLSSKRSGEKSVDIRKRVVRAREKALARFNGRNGIYSNAQMPSSLVRQICLLDEAGEGLIKTAMTRLGLSARAYDRILKVSRTIADLSETDHIQAEHVAEAIQYRSLDRDGGA